MTQAIKSKKNNDFPSTGIMEKYLNETQNTRFKISSRVTILQTCVGKLHTTQRAQGNKDREKLHATHREHRETEAEKNYMLPAENTERQRQRKTTCSPQRAPGTGGRDFNSNLVGKTMPARKQRTACSIT